MFDINDLASIKIGLASPKVIMEEWSKGEVLNAETINYRSQKPEPDGLFCEKIFGPSKDYECHCGKYKKIRYSGVVCEKCGVEVISKDVRRERMGHIKLASPCSHIWYLKGTPSRIGLILDINPKQLEEIVYYSAHICLDPGESKILVRSENDRDRDNRIIDDRNGKEIFIAVVKEALDKIGDENDSEYIYGQRLLEKLQNRNEPFDFFNVSAFIEEHLKAEFGSGAEAIEKLLARIDLDKEFEKVKNEISTAKGQKLIKATKRLEVIDAFKKSNQRPEWMILEAIPVIPADLRPMIILDGGRPTCTDLNELYKKIITRNNRLKTLIKQCAPEVMITNEKRLLQESVDALIDNGRRNGKPSTDPKGRPYKSLSGALKGKQGRFRQNLLGKRVDYSGRSVIAIGPDLKMYQCGIPREMAITLLRPFIAAILLEEKKALVLRSADEKINRRDADVYDIVERIISMHPVLLNRAPTLHRLGIQAFQPVLVEGRAIRLHPLVCTGFNADFDGDQMAVHVPLSKAAQEEAVNLMLASNNILAPNNGKPIVTPGQDILIGNYYLTMEATKEDFEEQAKKFEEVNDFEEANKYREYAKLEGKVFKDMDEVVKVYEEGLIHLHTRIAIRGSSMKKKSFTDEMMNSYLVTTVGKVIFNFAFPSDFPYINESKQGDFTKNDEKFFVKRGTNIKEYIENLPVRDPIVKDDIKKIINALYLKYGTEKTSAILDKIKDQGYKYSTTSGLTVALSDIKVIPGKEKIIKQAEALNDNIANLYEEGFLSDEERHNQICDVWKNASDRMKDDVKKILGTDIRNPLCIMWKSGARGSDSNFAQLMGMRGLMSSTSGETIEIPVKSCFREGLNVSEFFTGTHGARKGGADTALKTADSGYLTRRLVDVSQDVIVREVDCHSDHGTIVKAIFNSDGKETVSLKDRIVGRYSCHDIINPKTNEVIVSANTLINDVKANEIINAGILEVEIRSLFGCETKDGVCQHCYGINPANGTPVKIGEAVGIMAAQSIGEPGTQLTMRTFHTGGVATTGDITQGLPRVQELFEARNPKAKAIISTISGVVQSVTEKNGISTIYITNDVQPEPVKFETNYGAKVKVKKGDKVSSGDKLTEGSISPKELLNCSSVSKVEEYIVSEVQNVYYGNTSISDKHIEVIVRQMLRKVLIVDGGDTSLIPGSRISIVEFTKANNEVLLAGKHPAVAKPLILGITKAALESDSFLSAASFQETTRVLTDAAIKGKVDTLHGLKENVITGKLIPAGRGLLNVGERDSLIDEFDVTERLNQVKKCYIGVHDADNTEEEVDENLRHWQSLITERDDKEKAELAKYKKSQLSEEEIYE